MNERSNRWAVVLLVVLVAGVVGYGAYNLGVSHGFAVSGSLTTAPAPAPGAAPIVVYDERPLSTGSSISNNVAIRNETRTRSTLA